MASIRINGRTIRLPGQGVTQVIATGGHVFIDGERIDPSEYGGDTDRVINISIEDDVETTSTEER